MDFWIGIAVSVFMNLVKDKRNRTKFYPQAYKVYQALLTWIESDSEFQRYVKSKLESE